MLSSLRLAVSLLLWRKWRNLPLAGSSKSRPPPFHSEPAHTRPLRSSSTAEVPLTLRLFGSCGSL